MQCENSPNQIRVDDEAGDDDDKAVHGDNNEGEHLW